MPSIASTAEVHPFLEDIRPYMHSIGYFPKDTQSSSSSTLNKSHTKTSSTCSSCGSCFSSMSTPHRSATSYRSCPDVYTPSHSRQHSSSSTSIASTPSRDSLDIELRSETTSTRATSLDIIERMFGKEMAQEAERRAGIEVSGKGKKDKTRRFGRIF